MREKDKQIVKDSAMVVADSIVSSIPGLNIPWNLSKSLYGAGMELRQKRALEWVEMARDNPSVFAEEILRNEQFQDGFVFAFERYIRERSEEKRKIMEKAFLGFAENKDKEKFELEKIYHILSILNVDDLLVLKDINVGRDDYHQIYKEKPDKNENIQNLINAGILIADHSSRLGSIAAPFVNVTDFGKSFIKFIDN